jgi:glycosyltransferase involved in cell wall biosynthesis
VKILLVNWQDRDNPQAGGAEIHLHEIFGRLAKKGHRVDLLCGGWPGSPPRAELDGIQVHRVGTRQSFPFLARQHYKRHIQPMGHDVLVEDINKIPLYTTRWGAKQVVALIPHLFGSTAFQEFPAPMAAAVWFAERPLGFMYAGVPFEAISESTADDLAVRGIPRGSVEVIYPGIDSVSYTPNAPERARVPTFSYLGRLKRYKGVHICIEAFAKVARKDAILEIAGAGDYRPALDKPARLTSATGSGFLGASARRRSCRSCGDRGRCSSPRRRKGGESRTWRPLPVPRRSSHPIRLESVNPCATEKRVTSFHMATRRQWRRR